MQEFHIWMDSPETAKRFEALRHGAGATCQAYSVSIDRDALVAWTAGTLHSFDPSKAITIDQLEEMLDKRKYIVLDNDGDARKPITDADAMSLTEARDTIEWFKRNRSTSPYTIHPIGDPIE